MARCEIFSLSDLDKPDNSNIVTYKMKALDESGCSKEHLNLEKKGDLLDAIISNNTQKVIDILEFLTR